MNTNTLDKEYLTENIFKKDGCLYYEKNKSIHEIKYHNWHRYLSSYGWVKLNPQWIKKLNKYQEKRATNSRFGCLDCGEEGDCLFHCIAYALSDGSLVDTLSSEDIRRNLSLKITKEDYDNIIEIYKIQYEIGEFEESWDPNEIDYEEFLNKLIQGGSEYWGDFLLVTMIQKYLDINLIILYSNDTTKEYYNYPLMSDYNFCNKTIILIYENENHFTLGGHFQDGNMVCLFTDKNLPDEIKGLISIR